MQFKFKSFNISIDVFFDNCVYVLYGDFAFGCRFLINSLYLELRRRGINVILLNYCEFYSSSESILEKCKGRDFILLDDADLYMNVELSRRLSGLNVPVVMILHDVLRIDERICKKYFTVFDDSKLLLRC